MTCTHKCTLLSARCGWNCFDLSTETSENDPRTHEVAEDEYLLLSDAKTQQRAKKQDR